MAWCISAFGREEMAQVAIEEWASSSPIYTRRMQQALGYAPDVAGPGRRRHDLQGSAAGHRSAAAVHGLPLHGARPMARRVPPRPLRRPHGCRTDGASLTCARCATTSRTRPSTPPRSPRTRGAQVRPIHRPPRWASADLAADRRPHCAWTVIIDDSYPEVAAIPALHDVGRLSRSVPLRSTRSTRPTTVRADYAGPLVSDLDFSAFSHSALVRIADEVCVQMHLLNLGVLPPCGPNARPPPTSRPPRSRPSKLGRHRRCRRGADPPRPRHGRPRAPCVLHPLLNPAAYVAASFADPRPCRWPASPAPRGRRLDHPLPT